MTCGATKRSMNATLLSTLGKDSELISACGSMLRGSNEKLLRRAQEAGVVRKDVEATDVLRLVHGLVVAADMAPGDAGQADRMLSLVLAGLMPEPADGPGTAPSEAPAAR